MKTARNDFLADVNLPIVTGLGIPFIPDSELRRRLRNLADRLAAAPPSPLAVSFQAIIEKKSKDDVAKAAVDAKLVLEAHRSAVNAELIPLLRMLGDRGVPNSFSPTGLREDQSPEIAAAELRGLAERIGKRWGYVAFVDLLGFANRISSPDSDAFFEGYENLLLDALDEYRGSGLRYVVSSDSIVLHIENRRPDSLVTMCFAVSSLFARCLSASIPIRGAISAGGYRESQTTTGTILAGRPIVEAFRYEQEQDWLGVMLSPSTIESNPHIALEHRLTAQELAEDDPRRAVLRRYPIPFHEDALGRARQHIGFAIMPYRTPTLSRDERRGARRAAMAAVEAMRFRAPDPESQRKYANTREFIATAS